MAKHLVHIKSVNTVTKDGVTTAKLPTSSDIKFGEIAVNYAKGYETISIRNSNDEIVPFVSKAYVDSKTVSTVANQGLTDTEKSNARTNIGAGTSSFSGDYDDLNNKPVIPELAGDDAARAYWGGDWRMPTTAELQALGNAVNASRTNDYQGSGVVGLVCTDKTDSSKVLFLPAAGICVNGSVNTPNDGGYYWSSSLYTNDRKSAHGLYFSSSNTSWGGQVIRIYGFSVRGVLDGTDSNGHDYVEIGGLKWATMNIGANSVTDYGLYFAWGDTQGYTASQVGSGAGQKYFGWADYKYGNGTSSPSVTDLTKYNPTDGLTTLELSTPVEYLHKVAVTGDYNDLENKPTIFSGDYNDLSNKPTIPTEVTESTVSNWGFTKNTGTVTGVKVNDETKYPTNGVVDLGTVITDISGKVNTSTKVNGHTLEGDVTVTKSDVGLGNVTNDKQVKRTEMGANNGVATLDSNGKVPSSQLPSYVDDILEYDTKQLFPAQGESGKIYVDKSTDTTWRWSGTQYTQIKGDLTIGTTAGTAADGGIANTHYNNKNNPHSVTKAQVGLSDVVNTGDSATPVEGGTTKFTTGGAYTELYKKVDKVSGKGLSTNDYTTDDKNKLAGIEEGAEVNVQSDWNATSGDAFIKNKPTIPAAVVVKGDAESEYRTGNVNITPDNIGLGNVDNTADADKSVNYANSAGNADTVDGYHYNNLPYLPTSGGTITGGLNIQGGANLTLKASSYSPDDPGDLVFANGSNEELMRIFYDTNAAIIRFGINDSYKTILHSGNWSNFITIPTTLPANGGNSSTVNGHTVNSDVPANAVFTDTNTWRPLGTGSNDACAGDDPRLSDSRTASDVYPWAKAASKPSYSFSEISGTEDVVEKDENGMITVNAVNLKGSPDNCTLMADSSELKINGRIVLNEGILYSYITKNISNFYPVSTNQSNIATELTVDGCENKIYINSGSSDITLGITTNSGAYAVDGIDSITLAPGKFAEINFVRMTYNGESVVFIRSIS